MELNSILNICGRFVLYSYVHVYTNILYLKLISDKIPLLYVWPYAGFTHHLIFINCTFFWIFNCICAIVWKRTNDGKDKFQKFIYWAILRTNNWSKKHSLFMYFRLPVNMCGTLRMVRCQLSSHLSSNKLLCFIMFCKFSSQSDMGSLFNNVYSPEAKMS